MAKARQIVTVSHISRLYDISRQSVRNWIDRHEDFPNAVVGDGLKVVPHGKGTSSDVFVVSDDSGRTKLYPLDEVKAWVKANASSLRSQNGVQAAVESGKTAPKAKSSTKGSKASTAAPSGSSKKVKAAKPAAGTKSKKSKGTKTAAAAPKAAKSASGKKKGKKSKVAA